MKIPDSFVLVLTEKREFRAPFHLVSEILLSTYYRSVTV